MRAHLPAEKNSPVRLEVVNQQPQSTGHPVFYYDLACPEAYLAAESVTRTLPVVAEWQPIRSPTIVEEPGSEEREVFRQQAERLGLLELKWPERVAVELEKALLAATYAKQIGRVVAFSLAAFRQRFAAGRDLNEVDNVLIAAAACEVHPNAVLKAVELGSVRKALEAATQSALELGVTKVPTVRVGERLFVGLEGLEAAAELLGN